MSLAYENFWKNYFNFKGYTDRKQYWWCVLINSILMLIILSSLEILKNNSDLKSIYGIIWALLSLTVLVFLVVLLIPSISITIRRLRDAGFFPFLFLLVLIPIIGHIIVSILCVFPSKREL